MITSADLTRKAGIEEGDSEIEGKTVRVAATEWSRPGGARNRWENRQVEWAGAHESKREPIEFQRRKPCALLLASFFSIRNLCASHGLPDNRMIANDEMQMSNDEGMTKIRMPNLPKSVQSAEDHLRDLCVLCGEK